MSKTNAPQWSSQKAMARAWLTVAGLWSLGGLVKELIQPAELGWGPIFLAMEFIYIAVLGACILVFASIPEKGISGVSATVAGALLGTVLPLYWVFTGDQISALEFLLCWAPGLSIGLVFSWFRRKHA